MEKTSKLLVIDWMEGQPAPEAVLDLLACNCSRQCIAQKCVCVSNGLKCTDMCKLPNCENQGSVIEESDDDDVTDGDTDNEELENDYQM